MPFGDIRLNMKFDEGICRCHGALSPVHSSSGDIDRVVPLVDEHGNIDYRECIQQRLAVWLACKKGERPLHPQFGCCISEFINEPLTYSNLLRLKGQIERELKHDVFPEPQFKISNLRIEVPERNSIKVSAFIGNYPVEFLGNAAELTLLGSMLSKALKDLGMKSNY